MQLFEKNQAGGHRQIERQGRRRRSLGAPIGQREFVHWGIPTQRLNGSKIHSPTRLERWGGIGFTIDKEHDCPGL